MSALDSSSIPNALCHESELVPHLSRHSRRMHIIGSVCICEEGVGIAINPKVIKLFDCGYLVIC